MFNDLELAPRSKFDVLKLHGIFVAYSTNIINFVLVLDRMKTFVYTIRFGAF